MAFVQEFPRAELDGGDSHPVHPEPCLHIQREISGPLKGWTPFYQPLPAPRLTLNPYVGCVSRCQFCFLRSFPGLHRLGSEEMILTVYTNYADHFRARLADLRLAPPVVLSPFTDPLQPVNDRYGLSEKLAQICVFNNLPVELVTRYHVTDEILAMFEYLGEARIQISVAPLGEEGEIPPVPERLDVLDRINQLGVEGVLRLDPLVPGPGRLEQELERICSQAARRDIDHVVARFVQVPAALHEDYVKNNESVYKPHPDKDNWWLVKPDVQRDVLVELAGICRENELGLGVLDAPAMQSEFGSYERPFPTTLPVSYRYSSGESFQPLRGCSGSCRACSEAPCQLDSLIDSPWREQQLTDVYWKENGLDRLQGKLLE